VLLTQGRSLAALARYDEAEAALLEASSVLQSRPRPADPLARSVAVALASFYDARHADAPERGFDAKARHWRAAAADH